MKTKTILTIAILATLPLTAMADNPVVSVGPAAVPSNGTAVVATANPPYQTLIPTNDDKSHIASTAYVKGAYNDSIAAVNKLNNDKQAKLQNFQNNNAILPKVLTGSGFNTLGTALVDMGTDSGRADGYAAMTDDIAHDLTGEWNNAAALNDTLISAGTVMQWMREAGDAINAKPDTSDLDAKQDQIVVVSGSGTNQTTTPIVPKLFGSSLNDGWMGQLLVEIGTSPSQELAREYAMMTEDIAHQITGIHNNAAALDNTLISLGTVMEWMRGVGDEIKTKANASDVQNQLTTTVNNTSQNISATVAQTVNTANPSTTTLVSEAAIASAISGQATALNNKRVEIYTTWDNDNAKTEVAFVNATPTQSGQ